MTANVTATVRDFRIDAPHGATGILLQNLAAATVTLTFHQGLGLPSNGPNDAAANQLPPGDSIVLSSKCPVFVNSVANAAASFTYGFLA
jgi:hypothetical protein